MKKYAFACVLLSSILPLPASESIFDEIFSTCRTITHIQQAAIIALKEACEVKNESDFLKDRQAVLIGFIQFMAAEYQTAVSRGKTLHEIQKTCSRFFESFYEKAMSRNCKTELLLEAQVFKAAIKRTTP